MVSTGQDHDQYEFRLKGWRLRPPQPPPHGAESPPKEANYAAPLGRERRVRRATLRFLPESFAGFTSRRFLFDLNGQAICVAAG